MCTSAMQGPGSGHDSKGPLDPLESTKMPITGFLETTIITNTAAGDIILTAVTDTIQEYGGEYLEYWINSSLGSTNVNDSWASTLAVFLGLLRRPIIVLVSGGTEHVLSLTREGNVYSWAIVSNPNWGDVSSRDPASMGLPLASLHFCDARSSPSLPLLPLENIVVVLVPTAVQDLKGYKIVRISTGEHHSAAVNKGGDLLVWGRLNSGQLGLDSDTLMPDIVRDASGKPRYLSGTHAVLGIRFPFIGCGTCHNITMSGEGRVCSLDFGGRYHTGLGPDTEDGI
ncbi:regulator of chromosome condensation 1 [Tuber indicum]|nr:regulator of chromosome condensation 1 [Tuber indicum]